MSDQIIMTQTSHSYPKESKAKFCRDQRDQDMPTHVVRWASPAKSATSKNIDGYSSLANLKATVLTNWKTVQASNNYRVARIYELICKGVQTKILIKNDTS
jgi:hypothetical protein